jgi:serine/threonine protein kinase
MSSKDKFSGDSPAEIRWKESQGEKAKKKLSRHRRNGSRTMSIEKDRYCFLSVIQDCNNSRVGIGFDRKHQRNVILKMNKKLNFFKSEMAAMTRITHPGVNALLDMHFEKEKTYLVYEYVYGEDLFDWCHAYHGTKHTPSEIEKDIRPIASQLIDALSYCHSMGVAHRDVKVDNIRINTETNSIKLIDFGLAYVCDYNINEKTKCGSAEWAAPEIFDADFIDPFKSDVWAVGIVIYVLAHNYYPYLVNDFKGNIKLDRVRHKFSSELKEAFKALCNKDVERRLSMSDALSLPWVSQINC